MELLEVIEGCEQYCWMRIVDNSSTDSNNLMSNQCSQAPPDTAIGRSIAYCPGAKSNGRNGNDVLTS